MKIFFLLCVLLLPIFLYSQVDTGWVSRYNAPANSGDNATAIAIDNSGNVYVTGYSYISGTRNDYTTIKYDSNGDTVWVRRYNGPANSQDLALAIVVDASGNVYVTGESPGSGPGEDYATVKYNSAGEEQWAARYNGPGNYWDRARAMAVDDSGNVYVTGESYGLGYDYATIKYNSNGDSVWMKRYHGPGNGEDYGRAIAVDDSGNVYVTGYSTGLGTFNDCVTIKYNSNGDTVWVKRYNGPGNEQDYGRAIAVDNSGNVYVTGESYGLGTDYDYATIKYNPNGVQEWVIRYNGPENRYDYARAIAIDDSGNVYVTGESVGSGTSNDYATIKYVQKPTSVGYVGTNVPMRYSLEQNYPNPFNPGTIIHFELPVESYVTLKVYDVLGQEVTTLVNEKQEAGKYEVQFSAGGGSASGGDGSKLSSGVYFYRLTAGDYFSTKKFVLLK